MKSLKTLLLLCLTTVIFISCAETKKDSPLLNEKLTVDNLVTIAEKVNDDKDFTREEIDLFSNGLARLSNFGKDSVVGKTVADIINFQKEGLRITSLNGIKLAATRAEIIMAHQFQFQSINRMDTLDQMANIVFFKINNISNQDIKSVTGYLNIVNQQNQIVKKYPIKVTNPLEAGKSYSLQTRPYKHDVNNQNDMLIRTAGDKLKPVWQPIALEFSDGKVLNLGQ